VGMGTIILPLSVRQKLCQLLRCAKLVGRCDGVPHLNPSMTDPTPSLNAASAISSCRWVTGRRASPGACKSDSTTAKPQMAVASLSTSFLSQCQELLILEPFFPAHLQDFLYAQRKNCQADTCIAIATVGLPPASSTTPSLLVVTKKLRGAL